MRTYAVGDIHGNLNALEQVCYRSGIKPDVDTLITLGDIADGHNYTRHCIDFLSRFKYRIDIKGNHDIWAEEWMIRRSTREEWLLQGGYATVASFADVDDLIPYIRFFRHQVRYYLDGEHNLFVHGGVPPGTDIKTLSASDLAWDRSMWEEAVKIHPETIDLTIDNIAVNRIFIGHTAISTYEPGIYGNVINLDTGAGMIGRLTIMDTKTLEFWQSDES